MRRSRDAKNILFARTESTYKSTYFVEVLLPEDKSFVKCFSGAEHPSITFDANF